MAKDNFLAALERIDPQVHGQKVYTGDEFAGKPGSYGKGEPTGHRGNFMFATGIECSYPLVRGGPGGD